MVSNYIGLGDICSQQRDYQCALKHYQQSLAVSEELNDRMGLAKTYNKMGKMYLKTRETKTALHYFEKSRDMAVAMGTKTLVAVTSLNIGKTYGRMRRWEDALGKTDEAVGILEEVDIPVALQDCYYTRGKLLERKGDISGAEKSYRESVKILETLREDVAGGEEEMLAFVEMRGHVYQRLIALLLKQGKTSDALKYLERKSITETSGPVRPVEAPPRQRRRRGGQGKGEEAEGADRGGQSPIDGGESKAEGKTKCQKTRSTGEQVEHQETGIHRIYQRPEGEVSGTGFPSGHPARHPDRPPESPPPHRLPSSNT